ncbi:MAG TPA: cytochrome c oxidase assembly protein [Gammaproteobacteria bacterium]|jgi:cytochrome c oxidase assembly protein subunit 11|nr:cytochrome c oxidase assembly protein [Gammaproteobacteria bacterium]MBT5234801.1 cytochrome c oxidase assembly protein [Candidatus Neomarinimicrobiota bacterium]MBT3717912.1 cytochrome c oxidase assembly protein [Gammaproteobacteria bacterium]MBT3846246.1 cytochrome c oxidase assembly protein [Gammaproteobacteria bacterium]MBT3893211.1 cytochrome c oxidase assembly protein [Gammaproteobacteria bacterium]
MSDSSTTLKQKHRKTSLLLVGLVVGMFGFGFALIPLYNLYCQVTGLKNSGEIFSESSAVADPSRQVTVQFDTTVNDGLPWKFKPMVRQVKVHPGEISTVSFLIKNLSDEDMVGQAIPSVTPWFANGYFHKMECFCFDNQPLKAGESKEMPLRFYVSNDLPKDISVLNLSYTFLNTSKESAAKYDTAGI